MTEPPIEQYKDSERDLLIRIDERTVQIQKDLENCVTQEEFMPVKLLAFGGVAMTLATVVGTLLSVLFQGTP